MALPYEHLHASIVVHDFTQYAMSTSVNGATSAFGTSHSIGYITILTEFMIFSIITLISMFVLFTIVIDSSHMHKSDVTIF